MICCAYWHQRKLFPYVFGLGYMVPSVCPFQCGWSGRAHLGGLHSAGWIEPQIADSGYVTRRASSGGGEWPTIGVWGPVWAPLGWSEECLRGKKSYYHLLIYLRRPKIEQHAQISTGVPITKEAGLSPPPPLTLTLTLLRRGWFPPLHYCLQNF